MIGVDTNVIARAILEDEPTQAVIAKHLLKKTAHAKNLFISSYAIIELAWVLKVEGISRKIVTEVLLDLIDSPGIVIGNREVVVSALEYFIKGKADFGDYMILAEGEVYDAPKLASFDKAFCKDVTNCKHPNEFY